jgi:hypothetical protein
MSQSRYSTPPSNQKSLDQRLRNITPERHLQSRTRRQFAQVAIIAALQRSAKDRVGRPLFLIKGGVAIEVLVGLEARATKDLDTSYRDTGSSMDEALTDALATGWEGFGFRRESWEQIGATAAYRGQIKVSYQGQPFSTVKLEVSPAEGDAGKDLQELPNSLLRPEDVGLPSVSSLPVVTISYLIAQKLHACTDHSREDYENDRARDLIDLLLVKPLVEEYEYPEIKKACEEVFRIRAKQAWPPRITVLQSWPEIYADELEKAPSFRPTDVGEAARSVQEFIGVIDDTPT